MITTYVRRELRRRSRQAVLVSAGLAVGIGLVVTVSAATAGVRSADGEVLHSLYGVGTDMIVSKTATPGSFGGERFGFGSGAFNPRAARSARLAGNRLHLTRGQAALPAADVSKVARLRGVAGATGGLQLTDTSFSGTVPTFGSGGGGSFSINSFSVDGVQISSSGVGPLTPSEVTKGAYFTAADATKDVAIVSSGYATSQQLSVGSTLDVGGASVKVIGIATTPTSTADVFLPLATAQQLSGEAGNISTIYVSAQSASNVSTLASEVAKILPGVTVSTSASLASDVSGSLASTSSLLSSLGKWISVAALVMAVLVAGLLMMAAVSRRTREFGTLKAIGWRTRRIVAQVMSEGLVLGVGGGIAGLVLGIAGAEALSAASPTLRATVGRSVAFGGGFGGGGFGGGFAGVRAGLRQAAGVRTVLVHLSAPLQADTIALAVGLAIIGGLVAGGLGAWRASSLRPADALRSVQ
ncbi:protein of unknown function DUF214 [Acidimicrobium ferrooxidans DSM 10331]|uniref:Uncharacterized protein n=1 Tax=Acidimicrobium ferrooxidans (strain DSM 10331 / JCM 15462 / NBRC 103882 / ICP) TaxID=525909 RepID=C7LZT3_ACIFD|nr:ABC transporter permease [Acidimicrobium ferrooxidans]ACU54241.1 protein of unknown function DUF214 [Acidimicrobium ferrooxidans DSM 10331]